MKKCLALLVALACLAAFPALAQDYPNQPELQQAAPAVTPEGGSIDCNFAENPFSNCGFETGDLTDWVVQDLTAPFLAVQVAPGGSYLGYGFFTTAPTEGLSSAVHGFDGNGPGTIEVGQDVTIPDGGDATLSFDYRGAWDLGTFGATQDRTFEVHIEPSGGGAAMQTDLILTADAGTIVPDSGPLSGVVDVSDFTGQTVRVNFVWDIPETSTGPGFFEFDNASIVVQPQVDVLEIPTLNTLGLGAMILTLLVLSTVVMARRRRA